MLSISCQSCVSSSSFSAKRNTTSQKVKSEYFTDCSFKVRSEILPSLNVTLEILQSPEIEFLACLKYCWIL